MRQVAAVLAFCLCAFAAFASTPIPSEASGDYVGGGWTCRLTAYQHPTAPLNNVIEFRCTDPQDVQRVGSATWYYCPSTDTTLYWAAWGGAAPIQPYLAGYAAGGFTLNVPGSGAVVFRKVQDTPSPRPYVGCGSTPIIPPWPPLPAPDPPTPYLPHLCREFGLFCGP